MVKRQDITPIAQSLLSDVRRRKDDQSAGINRRQREREKRYLKYAYGAKLLMGIGNSMLRNSTEKFMNNKEVLENNIRFKQAYNGAVGRHNDRMTAKAFEGGEDAWYQQKAATDLTNTFYKTLPTTISGRDREKLIYNETYKAGQALKKAYADQAADDNMFLERVGKGGINAYTDAMKASRPKNIGAALFRGVKGLFVEDENPFDNSIKANELMKDAANVKAYGAYREAGLAPFKSEQKVKDLLALGKKLPTGITSSEIIKIKEYSPITDNFEEMSYRETTFKDGSISLVNLSINEEVQPAEITQAQAIGRLIKRRPEEFKQFTAQVSASIPRGDNNVLEEYITTLADGSNDQKRLDAEADRIYGQIMLTRNHLMKEMGLSDAQATQISTKMHVTNIKGLTEKSYGDEELNPQRNMLLGADSYHPALALVALDEIESNGERATAFNPAIKRKFLEDLNDNLDYYDSRLSPSAKLRFKKLIDESSVFSVSVGGRDNGRSGQPIAKNLPPASSIEAVLLPEDIQAWKKTQERKTRRDLQFLSDEEILKTYAAEITQHRNETIKPELLEVPEGLTEGNLYRFSLRLNQDDLEDYLQLGSVNQKYQFLKRRNFI